MYRKQTAMNLYNLGLSALKIGSFYYISILCQLYMSEDYSTLFKVTSDVIDKLTKV